MGEGLEFLGGYQRRFDISWIDRNPSVGKRSVISGKQTSRWAKLGHFVAVSKLQSGQNVLISWGSKYNGIGVWCFIRPILLQNKQKFGISKESTHGVGEVLRFRAKFLILSSANPLVFRENQKSQCGEYLAFRKYLRIKLDIGRNICISGGESNATSGK